jgi:hypothetical protein
VSRALITVMVATLSASACAPMWKDGPHDRPYQRVARPTPHPMPAREADTDWWDLVLHSSVIPLGRLVSPQRYVGWAIGGRPALDVNDFGQVPDSPWFENRIGRAPIDARALLSAAGSPGPVDGVLTIIAGKPGGITPGMVVRDSAGVVWFVKIDPPANPEMTTGAEIIADRLLWAVGYHVPEMHIVDLDVRRLSLAPDARMRDAYNRDVHFDEHELRTLLLHLNPSSKGRLRALFSRALPGTPIGSFSYEGTRPDDPNDTIPHERRRSLRGLWVFSAWLNNIDTRRHNTLDTFIPVAAGAPLGTVRHHLLDFGDSLGATGSREKYVSEGYAEVLDWREIGKNVLAFGLRYPRWTRVKRSPYRSVGVFEAEVFEPSQWRPRYPNPAFDEATPSDTFWAASILARFDKEHILAAVTAAGYREAGATDYVYRVLRKRREKLLSYAFRNMLALEDPRVVDGYEVVLADLEVQSGLRAPTDGYHYEVRWNRTRARDRVLAVGDASAPSFDVRAAVAAVVRRSPGGFAGDPFLTLSVWRPQGDAKGPRADVHLRVVRDHVLVIGIDREVADW